MWDSPTILVLYSCHHMPNNPQNTLGLPAIKYYGEMRSVRIETLSWIRMVDKHGVKLFQSTIPYYHKSQLMDYILVMILQHEYDGLHQPKQCTLQTSQMTHTHMLTDLSTHVHLDENNNDQPE